MPPRRSSRRTTRRRLPASGTRARAGVFKRAITRSFNPSPIFTESYVQTTNLTVNGGFLLTTDIGKIAQIGQYSALYTKYKILGAKFMLMPYYQAGSSDQNAVSYNNSQGQPFTADARIVYAIQDSPNQAAPVSENAVLQDNGCRIRMLKNKLVIRTKPVPQLQLANGIFETERSSPFINFDTTAGVAPLHYGVVGWISQPNSGSHAMSQQVVVYVKLTFQLKDPR